LDLSISNLSKKEERRRGRKEGRKRKKGNLLITETNFKVFFKIHQYV